MFVMRIHFGFSIGGPLSITLLLNFRPQLLRENILLVSCHQLKDIMHKYQTALAKLIEIEIYSRVKLAKRLFTVVYLATVIEVRRYIQNNKCKILSKNQSETVSYDSSHG